MTDIAQEARWLTLAQTATTLERSVATVIRWTRAGRLRAYRQLGRVVYDAREVQALKLPQPTRP